MEVQRSIEYGLGTDDEEVMHRAPKGSDSKADDAGMTAHYIPLWTKTDISTPTKPRLPESSAVTYQRIIEEERDYSDAREDTEDVRHLFMRSEAQMLLRASLPTPAAGWPAGSLVIVANDGNSTLQVGQSITVTSSLTNAEVPVAVRTAEEEEEQGLRAFVLHGNVNAVGEPTYIVAWDRRQRGRFSEETDWEDRRGVAVVPQRCVRLHALSTDISLERDDLQLQETLAVLYPMLEEQHADAIQRALQVIGQDDTGHLDVLLRQVQMEPEDVVYFYYQSVKHNLDVRTLCPNAPLHELLEADAANAQEAIDIAHEVSNLHMPLLLDLLLLLLQDI